eukprot:3125612-Ditylum_brightwellii.AAC.1
MEKWICVHFPYYSHLCRLHVWGCPAYVFDPKLQYSKKIPSSTHVPIKEIFWAIPQNMPPMGETCPSRSERVVYCPSVSEEVASGSTIGEVDGVIRFAAPTD